MSTWLGSSMRYLLFIPWGIYGKTENSDSSLNTPIAAIAVGGGSSAGHIHVHDGLIKLDDGPSNRFMSLTDVSGLLDELREDFIATAERIHPALVELRTQVDRMCTSSSTFCYGPFMSYSHLLSGLRQYGREFAIEITPCPFLFNDQALRAIKHEVRRLQVNREFSIDSTRESFPLDTLTRVCDLRGMEYEEIRLWILFGEIYDWFSFYNQRGAPKTIKFDPETQSHPTAVIDILSDISRGDFMSGIRVEIPGRVSDRVAYREWVSESFRVLLDVCFTRVEGGDKFKVGQQTSADHSFELYHIGQLIALALFEQIPLNVRFNHGLYKMLIAGSSEIEWTEPDLEKEDAHLFAEFVRLKELLVNEGEVYFVSMVDPTRELKPGGSTIRVTVAALAEWTSLVVSDIILGRPDTASLYSHIIDGFSSVFPTTKLYEGLLSTEGVERLILGRDDISTTELMDGLKFVGWEKDREAEMTQWFRELFDENDEFRMKFVYDLIKSNKIPFLVPLIHIEPIIDGEVIMNPSVLVVKVPSSVRSRSELEHALDRINDLADPGENYETKPSPPVLVPPSDSFESEQFDHTSLLDDGITFLADVLPMFETGSEQAFEALGGSRLLMEAAGCIRPNLENYDCQYIIREYSLLLCELASRKTKEGLQPLVLDSNRVRMLESIWKLGFIVGSEWASIQHQVRSRDELSPLRSLEIPPKRRILQDFRLVNIPYVTTARDNFLTNAIVRERIQLHVIVNPSDRIMWEVGPSESIGKSLARIASEDPLKLLNKIHIQFTGGYQLVWGTRAYIDWLSDKFRSIFMKDRYFLRQSDGTIELNPVYSKDPEYAEHYRAIGRLIALSLVDDIPIGVGLPKHILKLIMNGANRSNRDKIWNEREDFGKSPFYKRVWVEFEAVAFGGGRFSRERLSSWRHQVLVDEMYYLHKITLDSIVDGFYEILPSGIFDGVLTVEYLGRILSGNIIVEAGDVMHHTGGCDVIRPALENLSSPELMQFWRIITGMNTTPLIWHRPKLECYLNLDEVVIDGNAKYSMGVPSVVSTDDLRAAIHASRDDGDDRIWNALLSAARLFFEQPLLSDSGEQMSSFYSAERDLFSLKSIARLAIDSVEEVGVLEVISRILAGHDAQELVGYIVWLRESNKYIDRLSPLIQSEICPLLSSEQLLGFLGSESSRRLQYRENMGGVFHELFGSAKKDYPLANLDSICVSSLHPLLRRAIIDHRIGRSLYSSEHIPRKTLNLPYDFGINNVLNELGALAPMEVANRITIKYAREDTQAVGAGVYRNWFARMFDRMIHDGFFVQDYEGFLRVNRDRVTTDYNSQFRAIGRLFAVAIIDSLPVGLPFNHGLYQFLIAGSTHVWTETDLEQDDQPKHKVWLDVLEGCRNGQYMGVGFVSLDGEDVLVANGGDLEIDGQNVDAWAQAALNHHMYGRFKTAYDAIFLGFAEVLADDPSNIFSPRTGVEDLRLAIEGIRDVSTIQLMTEMTFTGYTQDEEETMSDWLQRVLDEGGNEFRLDFLYFVTGLKSMPVGGFNSAKHIIVQSRASSLSVNSLPVTHTCFSQIDLPTYESVEILKEKLERAVKETEILLY
jgi:hypothetical protein